MSATRHVSICRNGNMKDARAIVINLNDFDSLLKAASNKFKMKAKRAFTSGGLEITKTDWNSGLSSEISEIINNPKETIVISDGRDFIGFVIPSSVRENSAIGTFNEKFPEPEKVEHGGAVIRVLCNKSAVEEEAIRQLETTAKLPNVMFAVGMPDLHPGKGFPIGSATASRSVFYPHLVGTDIGCGMTLTKTAIKTKSVKNLDKWVNKIRGLEGPWNGDVTSFLTLRNLESGPFDSQMGTIGGGNHFAELQCVEEVVDREQFERLGMDNDFLYLLAHSGSRSLGFSVLDSHTAKFGQKGILEGSVESKDYMKGHDNAVEWAKANRDLITLRFLSALQGIDMNPDSDEFSDEITEETDLCAMEFGILGATKILDVVHNSVVQKEFEMEDVENKGKKVNLWLHRKGAAPSDVGPVVIPGSRGAFSYLVLPSSENVLQQHGAYSLAHGAGRKWARGKAQNSGRTQDKANENLMTTSLGSKVICEDKDLLFEEQPDAYKEIATIIEDLVDLNLIKVIAVFRPLITYKVRASAHGWNRPS